MPISSWIAPDSCLVNADLPLLHSSSLFCAVPHKDIKPLARQMTPRNPKKKGSRSKKKEKKKNEK